MPPISRQGNVPAIRLPVALPNSTVPRVFHHSSNHKLPSPKVLPDNAGDLAQDEPKPTTNFHQPLQSNEIRILEVFRDHDDCLAATLRTSNLDGPFNQYYAISYAWGDRKAAFRIRINNSADFLIPAKQYEILESILLLSDSDDPIRVWIDLLCIDQANILEKNRQVSLMGEIFRKAQTVFAYIGVNDKLSPLALLQSKYWMRRWIIQELTLARHVIVLAGGARLSWTDFVTRVEAANSELKGESNCRHQYMVFKHIRDLRSRSTLRQPQSLGTLLRDFRFTECAEPYDRIYALLSLASVKDQSRVQVDYTKSLFGLFLEVASLVASEHSRIDPYMMQTLYEDLASRKEKHILPGFRQFASRSAWMDLGPVIYYGRIEDANAEGGTVGSLIPDIEVWTIRVSPAVVAMPATSSVLSVSMPDYWRSIIPQVERRTIEPGDLCFQVMPFKERLLLARIDKHGQLDCYGRAEKFGYSDGFEAASRLRHLLFLAVFNLSSADGVDLREIVSANTYCIAESVSAKLNGAALVESIYRWSPEVDSTGELDGIGSLSAILDLKILNDIRRLKGGVAVSLEAHNNWRAKSGKQERQLRKEMQAKARDLRKHQTGLNVHEGIPERVRGNNSRYFFINSILVVFVLALVTLLLRDGWNRTRGTPR
jgi:hypothetical protein